MPFRLRRALLILFDKGGGTVDPDPSRLSLQRNMIEVYLTAAAVVGRWTS